MCFICGYLGRHITPCDCEEVKKAAYYSYVASLATGEARDQRRRGSQSHGKWPVIGAIEWTVDVRYHASRPVLLLALILTCTGMTGATYEC